MSKLRLTQTLVALSALFAAWSSTAAAQTVPGYAINRFDPSDRGSRWFTLESLDFAGQLRPAFGVVGDFAYLPLRLHGDNGVYDPVVKTQLAFHAGVSLAFLERFQLGVNVPLYAAQSGTTVVRYDGTYQAASGGGVGDIRLGADARLLGDPTGPFRLGLGARYWIPTGSQDKYTGDGKTAIAGIVTVAGDIGPIAYSARAGYLYRRLKETFGPTPIGDEILYGAAVGMKMVDDKLLIGPELQGSFAVSDTTDLKNSSTIYSKNARPLYALLGLHYTAGDFRVGAGAGPGLSTASGTPAFTAVASLEFVPAPEKKQAEPVKPADSDGDGILDPDDACPHEKGVATDDPKTNGCPPPPPPADADGDGILDPDDACPHEKGVKTDDPKTNGCPPPPDKDGDGILDADDACPDVKGVKTDDPKTNGCPPDPDRDKDGIKNEEDACPDEAGPADPDPAKNGCPKAFIKAGQIVILDQVKFATDSAKIVAGKESEDVLNAVLKVLNDHPEVKHVRVEGHTDNKGTAKHNKKLSADRAASVVKWLEKHGVAKDRLTSEGFGLEKPIGDNSTEAGRKANRRVEFHIEE